MTRFPSGLRCLALVAFVSFPAPALAEQTAKPTPMRSPEHRQFDFWVGEWDVPTPDGKPAGRNSITRELKNCVIHEHWAGAGGMNGESFNMWDTGGKRWLQTWVSDNGSLLLLDGAFQNGSMQLTGMSGPLAASDEPDHVDAQRGRDAAAALGGVGRRRQDLEDGVRRAYRRAKRR